MKEASMSISEFAKATGISRANLIFYDRVGLLSPEYRARNGYRRYTHRQLGNAYLILSLREIGIGIGEIKSYAERRTPREMVRLFVEQKERIRSEIAKLRQTEDMMRLYIETARESLEAEEGEIRIEHRDRQPVFQGLPEKVPGTRRPEEISVDFYDYAESAGMVLGYPMGVIVGKDELLLGDFETIRRCYFRVGRSGNAFKPEGLYAVGHMRCDYGGAAPLYRRMLRHIGENGLEVCGDAYEEYPLNEISTRNPDEYLVRVEIAVGQAG